MWSWAIPDRVASGSGGDSCDGDGSDSDSDSGERDGKGEGESEGEGESSKCGSDRSDSGAIAPEYTAAEQAQSVPLCSRA